MDARRNEELSKLQSYVEEIDNEVTMLLQNLQWDRKGLVMNAPMVRCKHDIGHRVPADKKEIHERDCVMRKEGYLEDEKLLPDPFDPGANTLIQLSNDDIQKIIDMASKSDPLFKIGRRSLDLVPGQTLARLQAEYTADERRAIHDAVVKAVPSCHDLSDLALPSTSVCEQKEAPPKSRQEVLAGLRDLKRRRAKYRVAAGSGSYSDVLRGVISSQMEMLTNPNIAADDQPEDQTKHHHKENKITFTINKEVTLLPKLPLKQKINENRNSKKGIVDENTTIQSEPSKEKSKREGSRESSKERSRREGSRESSKERSRRDSSRKDLSKERSKRKYSRERYETHDSRNKSMEDRSNQRYRRDYCRDRYKRDHSSEMYRRDYSKEMYRREPSKERYRRETSKERYRRGSSKERYRRESSKERYRRESSKERYRRGSSKERYRRGSSWERYRRGSSEERYYKDKDSNICNNKWGDMGRHRQEGNGDRYDNRYRGERERGRGERERGREEREGIGWYQSQSMRQGNEQSYRNNNRGNYDGGNSTYYNLKHENRLNYRHDSNERRSKRSRRQDNISESGWSDNPNSSQSRSRSRSKHLKKRKRGHTKKPKRKVIWAIRARKKSYSSSSDSRSSSKSSSSPRSVKKERIIKEERMSLDREIETRRSMKPVNANIIEAKQIKAERSSCSSKSS